MRFRQFKLITSIMSIMLVFAVLAVGVWAAASQTVVVKTTVSFTATAVSGTIFGTLEGVGNETQYYNTTNDSSGEAIVFTPRGEPLYDWVLGEEEALKIDSTEGIASDIVYTFTITNISTTDAILTKILNVGAGENLVLSSVYQDSNQMSSSEIEVTVNEGTPEETTETQTMFVLNNIEPSASTTIVVTFNVENDAISLTAQDMSFTLSLKNPNAE